MYGVYMKDPPPRNNYNGRGLVSMAKIVDGTSKTVMAGEAWFDAERVGRTGSNGYPTEEPAQGTRKDHWMIGSESIGAVSPGDPTEALGSTGVPPNWHKSPGAMAHCDRFGGAAPPPSSGEDMGTGSHIVGPADCDGVQLSFSSDHTSIVQVVMCDGSVQTIEEDIDLDVFERMGTRSDKYVILGN